MKPRTQQQAREINHFIYWDSLAVDEETHALTTWLTCCTQSATRSIARVVASSKECSLFDLGRSVGGRLLFYLRIIV